MRETLSEVIRDLLNGISDDDYRSAWVTHYESRRWDESWEDGLFCYNNGCEFVNAAAYDYLYLEHDTIAGIAGPYVIEAEGIGNDPFPLPIYVYLQKMEIIVERIKRIVEYYGFEVVRIGEAGDGIIVVLSQIR